MEIGDWSGKIGDWSLGARRFFDSRRGGRIDQTGTDGDTPLILACWYGHKYIAARLLDSGAQLDITNCDGNCALNVAAYRGNSEAVEMLLRHRATVDVPEVPTLAVPS